MHYFRREYVSVGDKKKKAERKIKALKKKNPDLSPIVIEGSKIAKTWWGKAWNQNLVYYADYDNRIGRGRSYVKNGFVAHLEIAEGRVEALVMGSRPSPYKVKVGIKKN